MFVVDLGNGSLSVENRSEVERDSDVDVGGSGCVTADVFEKEFGFGKVKILCVHEFRVWVRNIRPRAHFEEAVQDDDECRDMMGNSLVTFWTFSTVCWTAFSTDFRVLRHLFRNSLLPSSRFLPRRRSR
jgi:hypothetical protein